MLEIKNLEKSLADFNIKNINLNIKKDEYLVVLGPTGTGKTILLEIIAGLMKAEKGKIFYKGKEITDYAPEKRKIAMVYQDYMLFPHLNVKENIAFGLKVRGESNQYIEKEIKKIVDLFRINNFLNRDVRTLSGGEQQRVALARALITSPEVLLLDEPLSALDPATKESFQDELKRIHQKLSTITLHVTHDFNEALTLADRIAVMNEGKIEQIGSAEEVFQKPKSNYVAEFIGCKNILRAKAVEDNNTVKVKGKSSYLNVVVTDDVRGKVNLSIRPEDIMILNNNVSSSAKNCYKGKILDIKDRLNYLEVKVDIGVEIFVNIMRQRVNKLNLVKGKEVFVVFKASSVHIY